ncbi:hypothetical protein U472_03205 [Orenia metallireducens]|uniref:Methyl-accepting chemotaxis protein n=1 Tax=Orenia metallireducens TaxID=1413210 RepID=A0A1C0AB41_9FIRM|nr:methyl-accepting chemotaxis protein [Orenia metallireducens]OCL27576.1 hypothetical protein U472_03205 [Orenia metallireducens]
MYSIFTYTQEVTKLKRDIREESIDLIDNATNTLENNLTQRINLIEYISELDSIKSMNYTKQLSTLREVKNKFPLFESLYVMNRNGDLTSITRESLDNYKDKPWFKPAISGEIQISKSYISEQTYRPTVTIAVPLKDYHTRIMGVIAADINLKELQKLVIHSATKTIYVIDKEGTLIAHPNYSEKVLRQKNIKDSPINKRIRDKKEIDLLTYYNGNKKLLASYKHIETLGWGVIIEENAKVAYSKVTNILIRTIVILILGITLAIIIVAVKFSNYIIEPIQALMEGMKSAENRDLTESINLTQQDEIGDLANSFNNLISSQRFIIKSLNEDIHKLSDASQRVSSSAQESEATIDMTSYSVEEISASIQQIAATSEQINQFAQRNTDVSNDGKILVDSFIDQLNNLIKSVNNTNQIILNLKNKTDEVGNIINIINNIAKNTNLLALNASIEAARSSEGGHGFSVVAEEIRNLASETTKATEEITKLINETQLGSDKAMHSISLSKDLTEGSQVILDQIGTFFNKIHQSLLESSQQIEGITLSTNEAANHSNEIVTATSNITNISQELTSSANQLAEMGEELKEITGRFKI